MPSLDDLTSVIPPPHRVTFDGRWQVAEERLGTRLPDDYKRLVETYGPGSFDGFLWVFLPSTNASLDLVRQREVRLDALRVVQDAGEAVPYVLNRGAEQLLPWACSENGDVCYWTDSRSHDADAWIVVVNEARGEHWVAFEGSTTDFLHAVLSRTVRIDVFPDDFPSDVPGFHQLEVETMPGQ